MAHRPIEGGLQARFEQLDRLHLRCDFNGRTCAKFAEGQFTVKPIVNGETLGEITVQACYRHTHRYTDNPEQFVFVKEHRFPRSNGGLGKIRNDLIRVTGPSPKLPPANLVSSSGTPTVHSRINGTDSTDCGTTSKMTMVPTRDEVTCKRCITITAARTSA